MDNWINYSGDAIQYKTSKLGLLFSERVERAVGDEELLSVTMAGGVIRQIDSDKRDISNTDKSNYKVVRKGDIAYNTMRMWQGAEGHSRFDGIVSPAYTILIPSEKICPEYFELLFKTNGMLKEFRRHSQGMTSDTWNLKYDLFSDIEVTYPADIEVQENIAYLIKLIDQQIDSAQKTVDGLTNSKNSFLNDIFTQQIRFKDDTGSPYPEWVPQPLSHYLYENKDRNQSLVYGKKDVMSVSKDYGVISQIQYLGKSMAGNDLSNYHCVYEGDVVYTKSPLGEQPYGIIKASQVNGIVSTLYAVYHCYENVIPELIDYYFQRNNTLNSYLVKLVNIGAKHDMKVHNDVAISGMVCFPASLDEQRKIVEFFKILDKQIEYETTILLNWKNLKTAFIQKVFR